MPPESVNVRFRGDKSAIDGAYAAFRAAPGVLFVGRLGMDYRTGTRGRSGGFWDGYCEAVIDVEGDSDASGEVITVEAEVVREPDRRVRGSARREIEGR